MVPLARCMTIVLTDPPHDFSALLFIFFFIFCSFSKTSGTKLRCTFRNKFNFQPKKNIFPKKFCSENLKLFFREDSFESKLGGGLNEVFRVRGFSEMIWNEANSDLTSWRTKKFFFKLELDSEKLQKNSLFVPIWSFEFCFCKKQPIKFLTIRIFSQLFTSYSQVKIRGICLML